MMKVYIDNEDLKQTYGIDVLDYSGALSFPTERENEITWFDKSGVDRNLANIRFDAKEFVLKCMVKASDEGQAYIKIRDLVEYMFARGVFVLSLRDSQKGIRESFLCQRSDTIVGDVNIREQNSLYVFKLGLKDVNPNAVKYYNTVISGGTTIDYDKGRIATIYWGDGTRGEVNNSGIYEKLDYSKNGEVDIIVDVDRDESVTSGITANFSADVTSGVKKQIVNFTDSSTGDIQVWSWDFGDGKTSSAQNPVHEYTSSGIFTVTLQVFNAVGGSDFETKINYITIRDSWLMINNTDSLLINNTDKLLKN